MWRYGMKKFLFSCCSLALLAALAFGCSSGRKGHLDELLSYEEIPLVDFNLSGVISCQKCLDDDLSISGVLIEVTPKDDPLSMLAVKTFDGLGSFYIPDLRFEPGKMLLLYCYILGGEDGDYLRSEKVEVDVPDEDGGTAAVTINF
jgi:hypothetical protein